jgi:Mrp family chromosome partitioning ATPase
MPALRAHAKIAWAGVLVALFVGLATSALYGNRQEFAGNILYTPLPPGELNKHLLGVTDVKSLSSLVKSPECMKAVVESQQLGVSPQALAANLEIRPLPSSQSVNVSLRWQGSENAEAILNGVMAAFVERIGELRRHAIQDRAAGFAVALADCESELGKAQARLAAYCKQNNIVNFPHELQSVNADLHALAAATTHARKNQAGMKAQIDDIAAALEKLKQQKPAAQTQASAPMDTIVDLPLEPYRLQYLISEERRYQECKAQLEVKQKEYQRMRSLFNQGVVAQAEMDRLEGEIAVLKATVSGNPLLHQLQKELANPHGSIANMSSGQLLLKKLDVDSRMSAGRTEMEQLLADQDARRVRLQELLDLQLQAAPLLRQVEHLELERGRLQAHLDQLRVLGSLSKGEMTVSETAVAIERPFGSARRWLLSMAAFLGALGLWQCGLVTYHMRRQAQSYEAVVADLGVPVLASMPATEKTQLSNPAANAAIARGIRALALSLRERLPKPGSTVLFTAVKGGRQLRELLIETAAYLARRDERVLIIDSGCASTSMSGGGLSGDDGYHDWVQQRYDLGTAASVGANGLSNYLAGEKDNPADVVLRTRIHGVDLIAAGTAPLSVDILASTRMHELVEQLRRTYTIILIEGPALAAHTDLSVLTALQDGAILLLDAAGPVPEEVRETVQTYVQRGLPLLGCIAFNS